MAHAQKPDFVFRRNGRVHLNRRGRQFSRLLAAEVWASAVVMLDTQSSEVVWRVLATHSIRLYPLHFPSRASPCAITFQLDSTKHRLNEYATVAQTPSRCPEIRWNGIIVQGNIILTTSNQQQKVRLRNHRYYSNWCSVLQTVASNNWTHVKIITVNCFTNLGKRDF